VTSDLKDPGTMRAVVKTRSEFDGTEILEVPIPKPGPNDVLIKIKICSICGTDVHIFEWDSWAAGRIKPPVIYGHEFAGEIVEIGENVTNVKVGDYVSGECHIACGHCYNCRTGNAHVCMNTKIFGVDVSGIFADYACIPAANCWKNDPELPMEYATIQDPLGNAIHTAFATDIPGRNIAILGMGPIGVMSVAVCKASGAAQVFGIGRKNLYRVDLAKQAGADFALSAKDDIHEIVMEATDGLGVDSVLEMTGNPHAIRQSLKLLRTGGTLCVLGVFPGKVELDFNTDVVFKYATIKGINGRLMFDTWYRMAGLLKSGNLNLSMVVTHKLKFEQFMEGMEIMRSGDSGKIVLYMD